ncbi:hypothetical protein H4J38_04320 [Colwellia sp. BRX10-3]|uniref:hypothetical protein n=1 Tax=Colwellia sp. BRX10-3 TaxID=2759844 RepID=UPI0015F68925|nr:hypothetical protein [Colwellia sp. BRX10-3]MBA6390004.1 hypothetical protein [Colwellia sp. BRX10-3]
MKALVTLILFSLFISYPTFVKGTALSPTLVAKLQAIEGDMESKYHKYGWYDSRSVDELTGKFSASLSPEGAPARFTPVVICSSDNKGGNFALKNTDGYHTDEPITLTFRFDDDKAFEQELKRESYWLHVLPNNYFGENVLDNMLSGKYKLMRYRSGKDGLIIKIEIKSLNDLFIKTCK